MHTASEKLVQFFKKLLARVQDAWNRRTNIRTVLVLGSIIPAVLAFNIILNSPPKDFKVHTLIKIEAGEPLSSIADSLYKQNVIRFPRIFTIVAELSGNSRRIYSGDYYFTKPLTMLGVLSRISTGAFGLEPITFRVIEGDTVARIAARCEKVLFKCSKEKFIDEAQSFEGYLFPDTYTFLPNVDEHTVVKTLNDTFYSKIYPLQDQIMKSKYTLNEIVTFASILEKEERTTRDRRLIAGVIENRLEKDMALQVDATFLYLIGKGSLDLTRKDLAMDSPYNTYTHKGLPPGPIGSPSLDAIEAVLNPTKSNYLFYLANRAGKTFYGETYDDHLKNRRLYLNK